LTLRKWNFSGSRCRPHSG